MYVQLTLSIFWIFYGILGLFGIQHIPNRYKGHSWTKEYIRKQGITWLLVGVPWLVFYFVRKFAIPHIEIRSGIVCLILIALSLPSLIATVIWERKYKALLSVETTERVDGHTLII